MPQPSIVMGSSTDVGRPVVWSWSHRLCEKFLTQYTGYQISAQNFCF